MSTDGKTLQETLGEIAKEMNKTSDANPDETNAGLLGKSNADENPSGETESGETPEYVSGIDISDIPEGDRPRIRELLEKKAKLLEGGYQKKFQEVASFKKAQNELLSAGLSVDEAQKVLSDYLEQKKTPKQVADLTNQKKEGKKILDELIETAQTETEKSSLNKLRQSILEETNIKSLIDKVEKLEAVLNSVTSFATETKKGKLETELSSLSEEYGKELIEKYGEAIISEGLKFNLPVEKILLYVADPAEIKQAIALRGKKQLTEEKKNAIVSSGSGISRKAAIDTKSTTMAGLLKELSKK